MKELTDQLGSVIEEEDQIVTLLGSLPPSYVTVVTALETKMESLTLQFFQQALINEEQKRVMLMIMDVLMLCPEVDQLCQSKFVTICRAVLRQWEMTNSVHGGLTCVEKDI